MATIRKEIIIERPATIVWDAVRDVGAVHRRLCPGVLTDARLEPGARVVTFANGLVIREAIIDVDDQCRRLAYAASGGTLAYHHASIEVIDESDSRCRLVWITDLLPDEMVGHIAALVEQGAAAMKRTLEAGGG